MRRELWIATLSLGLVLAGASRSEGQYFGKNKVRYDYFDWQTYQSQHFVVHYYPKMEPQLEKVVSFAESAYDELSLAFDFQIQEPTPLVLYATHSEFLQNNLMNGFIPEGVAAFATSARFRMVMPIDLPDADQYTLILHELTHIFQYHILFGGSLGRSLTLNPPQWLMEGMASYFAGDESTSDRMFLRDAVVNDRIPPVTSDEASGFFAYRFGHAVFDFMEERWGKDGVQDFIFEFRNTIGARVGRAIERAFRVDGEDFDAEFRRWLRRKYLPELVASGEPSDFGRPFRTEKGQTQETSGVASPSGDLVAAFTTLNNDLDIALFDAKTRRPLRNLTKGYNSDFRNFVAQHLSDARRYGRDIAFSPDGNQLAVFVRREAGYSLALVDVIHGGTDRIIDMEVDQQRAPAWHPDGKTIAFSAAINGRYDILLLDLESLEIRNLTNDEPYDSGPAFSPDGKRMTFVTVLNGRGQLFEIDLDNPSQRRRLTSDEFNNSDPTYSSDGARIFFTSDRTAAENIYGLELESRQLSQYTNAITGCFMPTVLAQPGKRDQLVYTGYWKGRFDLFEMEIDEPIKVTNLEDAATTGGELEAFEPAILVSIDETKKADKKGFKLFLEDAGTIASVDDNGLFLGQIYLQFSDFLGDRRLFALVQSVSSFSNFRVVYSDLSRRWQWSGTLFDDRDFYVAQNLNDGRIERVQRLFRQTGLIGTVSYPFSFYNRFEFDLGFISRDFFRPLPLFDGNGELLRDRGGLPIFNFEPRQDDYPVIGSAFVSDNAIYGPGGPAGGHRFRIGLQYSPDIQNSGTIETRLTMDARKYIPLSRRSSIAMRAYASLSEGDSAGLVYFGGFDTLRGYDFREIIGDNGFYANLELRFPLIDYFITPVLSFQGIQGRLFFDIGGAWFQDFQSFDFYNEDDSRLQDGLAAYGFGLSVRFFGLDLHWDFAKRFDLKESGESQTTFWIGQRF